MKKPFSLDVKDILFIAEIGGNHEGDFNYAKRLVRDAISTGAHVVKLQTYYANKLTNKFETLDRFKHFKKFELSIKQHKYLAQMCIDNGVYYNSSIWDEDALKHLDKYLNFYKDKKKPIILSTGLSNFREINNTIKFITKNSFYKKKGNLALMQCTSCYPTIDEEVNLIAMNKLKKYCSIVGYSHHNKGDLAIKSAIALGAKIIEFHFTDDRRGKMFRDHKISLTKKETISLIKESKRILKFVRKDYTKPTINEVSSEHIVSFRRGLFYKKNLKKGHIVRLEDLVALRPNVGLDPRDFKKIIGKKLKISVSKLSRINYSDIK